MGATSTGRGVSSPGVLGRRGSLFVLLACVVLLTSSGPGVSTASAQASAGTGPSAERLAGSLLWEPLDGPPGGNTAFLMQDPIRPEHLYTAALRGLFRSDDQGDHWRELDPSLTMGAIAMAFSEYGAFTCATGGLLLIPPGSDRPQVIGEGCHAVAATGPFVFISRFDEPRGELRVEPRVELLRLELTRDAQDWVDVSPPPALWADLAGQTGPEQPYVGIDDVVATTDRLFVSIALGVGPGDANNVASRLLVSDDHGSSWNQVDVGFRKPTVMQRLIHQAGSDTLVALGHEGRQDPMFQPIAKLARISRDGGRTWRPLTRIRDIASPSIGDVDIVGKRVVLTNVDFSILELRGRDEVVARRPMPAVKGYAFSFELDELVYDATDRKVIYGRGHLGFEGLIRSRNGGKTWRRLTNGLVAAPAANLTTHPVEPDVFIAAGNLGYLPHITRDGGDTWQPLVGTANMADEVAFDPADPDHVLLISELTGILESRDGADSWSEVGGHFSADRVPDLAVTRNGDTLYAANLGSNVSSISGLRVDDDVPVGGGENAWNNLLSSPDYAYALAVAPDGTLFASYSPKKFEAHAAVWRWHPDRDGDNNGWSEMLRVEGSSGITDLAIGPGDPWRVYAGVVGEQAAVWASDDRGETWHPTHTDDFDFVTVHAVAIDPSDPDVIYAAPWGAGLFRSGDAGQTWIRLESPTVSVAAIVVDEDDPTHLLLGDRTKPVVWETTDGAETWQPIAEFDEAAHYRVMALARAHDGLYVSLLDRSAPGLAVFAGRPDSGTTFRLDDQGPHRVEGLPVSALAFADAGDAVYAVGHISGVYRISDDRAEDISEGLPDIGFNDLAIDEGQLLLAGGSDLDLRLSRRLGDTDLVHNIYRRHESGVWEALLDGDPFGSSIKQLGLGGRPGIFYVATGSGLYVTTDGGRTWRAQSEGLGVLNIGALAVSGDRVVVGTLGGGVSVGDISANHDVDWLRSSGPQPEIANVRIVTHPKDPSRLWASAYPGGVFRSADGGETWQESNFGLPSFEVTDPLLQGYYSLALDPRDPDSLYLAIFEHGIFHSDDGAATWRPLGDYGSDRELMSSALTNITVDRAKPGRLWLASADRGVFMSPDGGTTWKPRNKGLKTREVLTLESTRDGTLLAGTAGHGVYRLPPGKKTWRHLGRPVGIGEWKAWDRRLYQYSALLFDPFMPGRVFLGHFPGGFFISDDDGRTWRSSNLGVGNDGMFSVAAHPQHPERLFAGTYNGIMRSDDSGHTWRDSSSGMPSEQWPFSVVIDDQDPAVMYTATKNGQNKGFCDRNLETFCGTVMRSTDGGGSWHSIVDGLDPHAEYYMIELDPRDHRVLYMSSSRGVYVSTDRGEHWHLANEGLDVGEFFVRDNVAQNLKLTADGRHLLLGVVGYGVWRAELPEFQVAN